MSNTPPHINTNLHTNIGGYIAPGFEPVKSALFDLLNSDDEAGCGFCIMREDEVLVDLWGGTRDRKQTLPWQEDSLALVFSTTKAITALVMAWLYEQDRLDFDQRMTDFWPEFGQNGKSDITIAQALSHQAGLSGITAPMQREDWFDWDKIITLLAEQEPIWEPCTASGYHPITYGFLAGHIAQLADVKNRTLGTILREEICEPNDIDFHIGLPASEHDRCVDMIKPRAPADFGEITPAAKHAFMHKAYAPGGRGAAAYREAEFGAANGHGTARAIAQIMQMAHDGHIGGREYLSGQTLYEMSRPRISGPNLVIPHDLTFACGFMVNRPNPFFGPNESTLGHSGNGGSCTFADPSQGISGAYVMNKQSNILLGDPRPTALIKTVYECLEA